MDNPKVCYPLPDSDNTSNNVLGWLLAIGTVVSYLPQIIKLIQMKSSLGMSHFNRMLLVLQTFSMCTVTFMVQYWRLDCCAREWPTMTCLNNSMEILQQVFNMFCIVIINVLVLIYYETTYKKEARKAAREWQFMWLWATVWYLFAVVILCSAVFLLDHGRDELETKMFENVLSVFSGVMVCAANGPQIVQTWRVGKVGSVSLVSTLIQLPGAGLLVMFQMFGGIDEVQIWGPSVVQFIIVCVMTVELFYFHIKEFGFLCFCKPAPIVPEDVDEERVERERLAEAAFSETDPLLPSPYTVGSIQKNY